MPDFVANLPLALLLIFGGVFILCGLMLVVMGWSTLRLRLGQSNWMRVPAEILAVSVEPRTLDETLMYLPKVTYRFSAGGSLMTASRMHLVERMYATERGARLKLEQYPPGTTVMVRFPVDRPQEVVLEPGGSIAGLTFLLLGLAMVAAPLLIGALSGFSVAPLGLAIVLLFGALWVGSIRWRRRERRARREGLLPPMGGGSETDVERLLARGEKMLAIRLYRELHGTGLKEAREAVEALASRRMDGGR